jgi:hypothetical protein
MITVTGLDHLIYHQIQALTAPISLFVTLNFCSGPLFLFDALDADCVEVGQLTDVGTHLPWLDVSLPIFVHRLLAGILEDQDTIGQAIRVHGDGFIVAASDQFTGTVCFHAVTDFINAAGLIRGFVFDFDFGHEVVGALLWASTAFAPKPIAIPAVTNNALFNMGVSSLYVRARNAGARAARYEM